MKTAILDTDIVSYFLKGNARVLLKVDDYIQEYGILNISVITYYEILSGLLHKDAKQQLSRFMLFVENNNVIPLTLKSAVCAAEIQAKLLRTGLKIDHPDTLIAGTAIANQMQLITNNIAHFSRIEGLEVVIGHESFARF